MMSDTGESGPTGDRREEDSMAELLRLAGPRAGVAPERAARVREAVHRAWLSNRRRRTVGRSTMVATTLLAAAAMLVMIVRLSNNRGPASPPVAQVVATGERIEGAPRLRRAIEDHIVAVPLSVDTAIRLGDVIETDAASRVAIRTSDGSSLRLDRGSRARLVSLAVIELVEGAVYVATSGRSRGFEVLTAFGTVRDRGTRFEVRLGQTSLRLRVRDGLVEIRRGHNVTPARAGTEATVTPSGVDTRKMSTYGSEWEWTASLAPAFEIEGRPLAAFLEHVVREEGWRLHYADAALATAASTIVLHGSVDGLRTDEALAVALATSGLQYRLSNGELIVFKPSEAH
jgi:ferric-dicitrate binding protein FerR (iron transport regulator)